MRALTATAVVNADHTLTLQVPTDILPGVHQVVLVLDAPTASSKDKPSFAELTVHQVGLVDPSMTFRREDMYGDDGR